MLLDDLVEVFFVDEGVPDPFRVDHQRGPLFTTIEAAGCIDAHLALPGHFHGLDALLHVPAQLGGTAFSTAWPLGALVADIGAEEKVAFVIAHEFIVGAKGVLCNQAAQPLQFRVSDGTFTDMERAYSPIDRLIGTLDQALRTAAGDMPAATRANPAADLPEPALDADELRHVAGLMRINHTGEVCAQALYAGQAATARSPEVKAEMAHAAEEEIDHLAWCQARLDELDSPPSVFNPLWYAGSFALGAAAGLAGDGWSLGFLKETENQVEAHLEEHIERLPAEDGRSRAILAQMKEDEARHAEMAEASGAYDLPWPVREAMRLSANFMKAVAYRL